MALLCIAALLAHATPASAASAPGLGGGSSKCDPTVQSCAPGTGGGIDLGGGGGGGGGGGSCTPSPGGSTCGGAGPATQGNSSSTNQGAGNPIHLINGNKYQREVDMPALPGVLGLEVVRHYNSSYSRAYVPPGMLGRGWLLSYEARLYDHPTNLQIVQADGTRIIFSKLRERPSLCAREQPGNGIVRIEGPDRHYTWQWMDGRELRFNHLGRLTRISLPSGEQAIDTPLGRIDYRHGSAPLPGSTQPQAKLAANLVQASLPSADGQAPAQRHYHYEDPRHPTLLTGISVQGPGSDGKPMNERLASYAYGDNGRAILSVRGPPDSLQEKITLDLSQPWKNTLTNSLGQQTTYHYDTIGGQWRLLQVRGPGCASCGPGDMRYQYDAQGRLTEATRLDAQGRPVQGTRTDLDPFGRPLAVYRIAYANGRAQAPQLQVRYGYGKDAWKQYAPELIARPSVVPGREHQIRIRYNSSRQPLQITETGFSPLNTQGQPTDDAAQATPIERSTRYRYTEINGRSVLVDIDGPLPASLAGYDDGSASQNDLTRLRWDGSGSYVTRVLQPDGTTVALAYDKAGRIIELHSRDPSAKEDETGWRTELRHDAQARLVAMRSLAPDASVLQEQSWRYDALGHLTETGTGGWPGNGDKTGNAAYAAQTRQHHDALGRLLWSADVRGSFTQHRYDTESRLLQSGRYGGRAGDGSTLMAQEQTYLPDAPGQPPSLTSPGGATAAPQARQFYDDFGRSVATLSPDSGLSIRGYDATDRLVSGRDALGQQARYEYDLRGRILRQTITQLPQDGARPSTTTTRWRYQGPRLVALEHPEQSEAYEYNARGLRVRKRITRHEESAANRESGEGSRHHTVHYEYDSQDRLTAASLPDGSWLHYLRDGHGQITGLQRQRVHTRWLRWLSPAQTIATGFERDLVGPRGWQAGNGIEARYQRSREGRLARIAYRHPGRADTRTASKSPHGWMLGARPADIAEQLLGLAPAHAAEPMQATATAGAPTTAEPAPDLPGALGLPSDPQALLDLRYLWDSQGNLLLRQDHGSDAPQTLRQDSHAYDMHDRLIAQVQRTGQALQASRYHYDEAGRRTLDQQDVAPGELQAGTRAIAYQPGSHRWSAQRVAGQQAQNDAATQRTQYNANGQPLQGGPRSYRWDALGRLEQVSEHGALLARYRYNHRGERIAKHTGKDQEASRAYLYESGQLSAELDAQGRITRQYIHLGQLPLAVIDTPQGRQPADGKGTLGRIVQDLGTIASRWLGDGGERLSWLHTNHLGAVEAATDTQGQLIWRARYTAFGQQQVLSKAAEPIFEMPLRLPGQYHDTETGLHYNLHRYYDPGRGQYLTPDPLGTPDGPNPYSYVRGNPLRYVDPEGLILFAFDGTNNSNPPPDNDTWSNVYKFYLAYDEFANGKAWYMNGVGRYDKESKITAPWNDHMVASTARARVDHMLKNLDEFMEEHMFADGKKVSIDIVGFSRGAAMSRDFANRVATRIKEQHWKEKSECMELRFLGLWDTVAQFGATGRLNDQWQLAIPPEVQHVFQAVALNEHRQLFPGESIDRGTQLGFIGSHADIGGSFGTGDLSNVALNWIAEKAKASGLTMNEWEDVGDAKWGMVTEPVLHDKSLTQSGGIPEDSLFCLKKNNEKTGECTHRRVAEIEGMTHAESQRFIKYRDRPGFDRDGSSTITGDIDMKEYAKWLKENYGLTVALQ
jgi:RHS repeat-associated protein